MSLRSAKPVALLFAVCLMLAPASIAHAGEPSAAASVIGGEVAPASKFPGVSLVIGYQGGRFSCTGTVVAPRLVLTAAHCVLDSRSGSMANPATFQVITGTAWLGDPERQDSKVTRTVPYPHLDFGPRLRGFGDAALLVLATPTTAPPVALATPADGELLRAGTHAYIAGWGRTRPGGEAPPEELNWAKTVIEGTHCEGFVGRVCAIDFPSATSGGCHGDSGGPLFATGRKRGHLIQVGVVEGGFGRCSTRRPELFTRVDLVSKWVRRWIARLRQPFDGF